MARCPYAPHRLVVAEQEVCRRCGGDVRLYAAVRYLPDLIFNDARRVFLDGDREGAAALAQRAIHLRANFPEAHWLMAAVQYQRGQVEAAQHSLALAESLGAKVDPAWLVQEPIESNQPSITAGGEDFDQSFQAADATDQHAGADGPHGNADRQE